MKLKLDENVGGRCLHDFQAAEHDAATVAGEGLAETQEDRLIEICREEGRILVTLDLDSSNPLIFEPRRYPGIAVLRLPSKPTPADLYDVVQTLIGALSTRAIAGKLWIVEHARIREYQPEDEEINRG
ncbi:MAG: hypothetical protein GEU73_04010 [Chloroflexi bacterium]|nr:hypothetical protein [Chloroflexota bacterium]